MDRVPVLALTTREAAQALKLGERTVRRLMATGRLPSVKVGGSRRIPVSALHRSLDPELDTERAGGAGGSTPDA